MILFNRLLNFWRQITPIVYFGDSIYVSYFIKCILALSKDGFARRGTITIKTLDPAYQDLIGQRDGLSKQDIYQLNRMYKCGEQIVLLRVGVMFGNLILFFECQTKLK